MNKIINVRTAVATAVFQVGGAKALAKLLKERYSITVGRDAIAHWVTNNRIPVWGGKAKAVSELTGFPICELAGEQANEKL